MEKEDWSLFMNNKKDTHHIFTPKEIAHIISQYPDTTRVSAMFNITDTVQAIVYDMTDDVLILTDDAEFARDELFWDYDEEDSVRKEDFIIYQ